MRATTRAVASGALWNLAGRAGPIVVALLVTPALVTLLGPTRWGIFTMGLGLVGMLSIFDFGFGRALTRLVATRLADGDAAGAAGAAVTGLAAVLVLGVVGSAATAAVARPWVMHGLHVPAAQQDELLRTLYVLCAAGPLVMLNAAMWGVIAACGKFRAANLLNIPINAFYYVGPLLVLLVRNDLADAMSVLVLCRLVLTVGYWRICCAAMPMLRQVRPRRADLGGLMAFGGWLTVSNLAWPLLTSLDRFVIAAMLSTAAVGWYATPFDLVGRFAIVTISINVSAYPAMAATSRLDPARTVTLFRHGLLATTGIILPASLIVIAASAPLMTFWLGRDFAAHAAPVLCWLGFGAMATSLDGMVIALIDGIGRPDVNARLALLELAVCIPLLLLLLPRFGIEGAAIAWSMRCGFNLLLRVLLAGRLYPALAASRRTVLPLLATTIGVCGLPLLATGLVARGALCGAACAITAAVAVGTSLSAAERHRLLHRLRRPAALADVRS